MELRRRRKFDKDFKLRIVRLVLTGDRPVKEIAQEFDVLPKSIYYWVRQFRASPEEAFPGNGNLPASEQRLRDLERENARLRAEKAILKKALAVFSDPDTRT